MENCGAASVQIANRVRDPAFIGTSQLQMINLLSYSQQVVNGALSDVVQSATLTLQPRTLIYGLSAFVPAAMKVLSVQDAGGRDLDPLLELPELQSIDMRWPVAVADAPRGFLQVGADTLIIYPGVNVSQPVTVKYGQYLPTLAVPADNTLVPSEDDTCVNALTEALLLLKGRDLNAVKQALDRYTQRLKELRMEKR